MRNTSITYSTRFFFLIMKLNNYLNSPLFNRLKENIMTSSKKNTGAVKEPTAAQKRKAKAAEAKKLKQAQDAALTEEQKVKEAPVEEKVSKTDAAKVSDTEDKANADNVEQKSDVVATTEVSEETIETTESEDAVDPQANADEQTDPESSEGTEGETGDTAVVEGNAAEQQAPVPLNVQIQEPQLDDEQTDESQESQDDAPVTVERKGKSTAARIIYATLDEYVEVCTFSNGHSLAERMQSQVRLFSALRDVFLLPPAEALSVVRDIVEFFREHEKGVCNSSVVCANMDNIRLTQKEIKLFNSLVHLFYTSARVGMKNVVKMNKIDIPYQGSLFTDKVTGARAAAVLEALFAED